VTKSVLARAAATFAGKTPFEATLGETGGSGGGGGGAGGGAGGGGAGGGAASGGGGTTVGIDEIISGLLTEQGSVIVDGRTNSLIVTDIPENFPRIEAALVALDIRTHQIMVDAELIETSLSKAKDLGIEWGTGAEGDLLVYTPGSTGRKTTFPFNMLPSGWRAKGSTPFPTSTLSAESFKGVLQAIQSDSDTKILARPKVLTLDNESAVIRLTSNEAIGFESSSQATTGTQTSEPERETTGVVLVVTPQVNENDYITMVVEPSVTKTVVSQITPPTGQAKPRDPKTRSSRTIVRIRSGDTLVVGGLIDRSDQETLTQVPILSGIPFIGEAFKNKEISDTASELIVFITPRLLQEPTEAQIAAIGQTPMGLREQEPVGLRQETIEETLNALEKQPSL
jgi:type II secretory pathway component GspD/PulD (secretin)